MVGVHGDRGGDNVDREVPVLGMVRGSPFWPDGGWDQGPMARPPALPRALGGRGEEKGRNLTDCLEAQTGERVAHRLRRHLDQAVEWSVHLQGQENITGD